MTTEELATVTKLMMNCDPWPVLDGGENQAMMRDIIDLHAQSFGYDDWTMAYHALN